jgi:elongation factor 1-beta
LFISSFTPVVLQKWIASSKPAEVKKTEAPKTNDDDFDPFADDAEVPAKKVEKPQPKPAKAAKPKPVAKSIVVFEVKIYDAEVTNLDELAQKILALKIEGLVWNNQPKKV